MAATAAEVDAGDLTPRLRPEPAAAAELRTVVETFNHMLDRLERAFARQRRFVSDASHELRTPLTAIRGQLEVLAREPDPSPEEVRRVERLTLTEMRRVERLVDDMLVLAHLDEGAEPALGEVAAVPFLRGLAEAGPGGVEVGELAAGTVPIDADLVAQVVRNLISNARRHAGPDGRVVALGARASATGSRSRSTTTAPGSRRRARAGLRALPPQPALARSRQRRQRPRPRHRPLDRRAARGPDLDRGLGPGRRLRRLRAARLRGRR